MPNRQPSAHDECSIKSLPRDKTEAEAGATTTCTLCDRQFFLGRSKSAARYHTVEGLYFGRNCAIFWNAIDFLHGARQICSLCRILSPLY